MKMKRTLALFYFLILSDTLVAQTPRFLNGSLEPVSPIISCRDISAIDVFKSMGSVYLTIVGPQQAYLADTSCHVGSPKDGKYFLGLHYSPTLHKGSQLLFQIDPYPPGLLALNTYYFGFYYKGNFPVAGTGADIFAGALVNPNDSLSDSLMTKGGGLRLTGSSYWQHAVVSVTPSVNTPYVWIAITNHDNPDDSITVWVDKFSFDTTSESINELYVSREMGLYPNPTIHTDVQLEIPDNVDMPCSLSIYDISGRLLSEKVVNTKTSIVDCSNYPQGVYILKLRDQQNTVLIKRLIVE